MLRYVLAATAALTLSAPAHSATRLIGASVSTTGFSRLGQPAINSPYLSGTNFFGLFFSVSADPTSDFELFDVTPVYNITPSVLTYNIRYTAATDLLEIYGSPGGLQIVPVLDDVYASILNATSGAPTVGLLRYSRIESPSGEWVANWANASVPEPATWAMLISGFGLVGAALRSTSRRRRPSLA